MSSKIPGSSTAFIVKSLVDEAYPIGAPLTAKYKRSFAYKTIGYRLPVILTKIIDQLSRDKNEIGEELGSDARAEVKNVVGCLAKLKNELQTNKPVSRVDSTVWNDYISKIALRHHNGVESEVTYYLSPWLFVECYLYYRVYEAFSFTNHLKNYDYVQKQKQSSFTESVDQCCVLGDFVLASGFNKENFMSLLQVSLWGNRCDLSLSAGASNSQSSHLLDQLHALEPSILCNNSEEMWKVFKNRTPSLPIKTVGYILDNAGFELFTDFCFADILSRSDVDQIDFYVKEIPWFISDALAHDIDWLLDSMQSSGRKTLVELAETWNGHLKSKRWRIITHGFWTLPHAFNEMEETDPSLYSLLSTHHLLIFKGDLNYRKLVGDINWKPDTPFREALRGFLPAPLVTLRTCKADTVAGLKNGLAEEISAKDPDWLVTGEYGLIQLAS